VKPEAERSLEKADQCLTTARAELDINLSSEAGRNAYLAAFHAARAFIFERTDKFLKGMGAFTANLPGWYIPSRASTRVCRCFSRKPTT
jgi:uncharacterized protein (UPF0332 family)